MEYEYKLMLQPQQLNEQLREAHGAKEAAEQALYERIAELNQLKANAAELQERFLADMEAQHAVATEQLEAAYDTRFAVCHSSLICPGRGALRPWGERAGEGGNLFWRFVVLGWRGLLNQHARAAPQYCVGVVSHRLLCKLV